MKITNTERLRRFYRQFSGSDRVLVLINADPDAIASAMAVKRLLWRKAAGVTLSHFNAIKRPDNTAMIRLLKADLIHLKDVEISRFNKFVIVDSQPDHNAAFSPFTFDVIIDHHPEGPAKAPFTDIRPDYGATASMMTEYLRAANIKPAIKLATGLYYAIKTDTSNFQRKTRAEDLKAFQFLFKHANPQLASKIEGTDLRLDFLKYFKNALEGMCMRKNRVFVHLGNVINPDICVLIAEFFMRVNPVQWTIISGICDNKLTVVFRNDGLRKNAGVVAKQSFGHLGSAGGHKSMARAEIALDSLEVICNPSDCKFLSRWIIEQVEKKTRTSSVGFRKKLIGLPYESESEPES